MKLFHRTLAAAAAAILLTTPAGADGVDMNESRRALAREGDIRIDAQLVQEELAPGRPITVIWQIENLSKEPVAVADRVAVATFDEESRTITFSIGSEVPGERMPHMVVVQPGEKRVMRIAAKPSLPAVAERGSRMALHPRFVQVKVILLRELDPFRGLIEKQSTSTQRIPDELFDAWFESADSIYLNTLPVFWSSKRDDFGASAAERSTRF